jgi:hypothetical protein
MKFKDFIGGLILVAFAGYSTWKGMQTIASISIFLFVCILYKSQIRELRNIVFGLLRDARQAKLGQLEFQIGNDNLGEILNPNSTHSIFAQMLLQGLNSEDIGLLTEVYSNGKYNPKDAVKDRLRTLRLKGLIDHNAKSLGASNEVWATETGKKLIEEIMKK